MEAGVPHECSEPEWTLEISNEVSFTAVSIVPRYILWKTKLKIIMHVSNDKAYFNVEVKGGLIHPLSDLRTELEVTEIYIKNMTSMAGRPDQPR